MKKVLALIFALVLVLSLVACGGGNNDSSGEQKADTSAGPTNDDLAKASGLIKDAQDEIVSMAAEQLDGWTTYSNIMASYFVDSKYQDLIESTLKKRAERIHISRGKADTALSEAKTLLGSNGTGDYYNAVKEYYKAVSVFYNLVSEFPEGYSQLTFSNAVKDNKAKCDDAYSELSFYE